MQNGAGELDAPTLSYAFHTAFAPAGTMLRVTASDLDLLGGHVLVRPLDLLNSTAGLEPVILKTTQDMVAFFNFERG